MVVVHGHLLGATILRYKLILVIILITTLPEMFPSTLLYLFVMLVKSNRNAFTIGMGVGSFVHIRLNEWVLVLSP